MAAAIFFYVSEGAEGCGSNNVGAGPILDSGAQIMFGGMHQSAIRMIDDHNFLGAQQVVRYDKGAYSVFSDDAAGIAKNVCFPGFQS